MKRYISVIEENGAWRIEGFYKTMPDDDKQNVIYLNSVNMGATLFC